MQEQAREGKDATIANASSNRFRKRDCSSQVLENVIFREALERQNRKEQSLLASTIGESFAQAS